MRTIYVSACIFLLSACALTPHDESDEVVGLSPSYLISNSLEKINNDESIAGLNNNNVSSEAGFTRLDGPKQRNPKEMTSEELSSRFDDKPSIELAMDQMPFVDFLHFAFGQSLGVNYILDDAAKNEVTPVTLNIQEKISKKRLFQLIEDVLEQKNFLLTLKDDLFYISKYTEKRSKGEVVYGFGNKQSDVPQTSREIFQIVPLKFGMRNNYNTVLGKVTSAQLIPDFDQGIYYLRGKRDEILRALDFLSLVDVPYFKSQNIGLVTLTFITPEQFIENINTLLENEGIGVASGKTQGKAVSLVPLNHLGAVAIFAVSEVLLERIEYWTQKIDKPSSGGDSQYFVYQPQFARSTDLMKSLAPLLSESSSSPVSTRPVASQSASSPSGEQAQRETGPVNASGNGIRIVVDESTNSLIVITTGEKYQQLLPLMKRLDVMPKQVMLEVTIAEVTLKDDFKHGIEFFFNRGNYGVSTSGAFGLSEMGGLSYILNGLDSQLSAKFFQDNSLINIISRPSIVVRDGLTANISVGTDIPIIGSTTTDPLGSGRETTTIQYRKTGVQLDVTPTINSQGVVIMQINQQISNTVDAGVNSAGSPSIFERTINTEVVADSGQTIVLGGLISENKSKASSRVPGLGDIPLLGYLFSGNSDTKDKTELVVLVTPRIIHNQQEWEAIRARFKTGLQQIKL